MGGAAWYSVVVEVDEDGVWAPFDRPWTQVWDCDPEQIATEVAQTYDLGDVAATWRVRVYAGHNRFDDLLTELAPQPRSEANQA